MWLRRRRHLRDQVRGKWPTTGGNVVMRHRRYCLTGRRQLCSGTARDLHLWVGQNMLGTGSDRDLMVMWYLRVGESRRHLLVGIGRIWGRQRRCWVRS